MYVQAKKKPDEQINRITFILREEVQKHYDKRLSSGASKLENYKIVA
jgi:hypothetical protein